MSRRLLASAALAAALLSIGAGAAPAQDFGPIQVRTRNWPPGVHLLQGAGGNVLACAGDGRLLLVDADYEQMADKLLAAAAALESGPIALAVATHWHFDHVGGFGALAAAGAVLAAHESVSGWMAAPQHPGRARPRRPGLAAGGAAADLRRRHADPALGRRDGRPAPRGRPHRRRPRRAPAQRRRRARRRPRLQLRLPLHRHRARRFHRRHDPRRAVRVVAVRPRHARRPRPRARRHARRTCASTSASSQEYRRAVAAEKAAGRTLAEIAASTAGGFARRALGQAMFPPGIHRDDLAVGSLTRIHARCGRGRAPYTSCVRRARLPGRSATLAARPSATPLPQRAGSGKGDSFR